MSAGSRTHARRAGVARGDRTRTVQARRPPGHARGRPKVRYPYTARAYHPHPHYCYWRPLPVYFYGSYPYWYPRTSVRYVRVYGEESYRAPSGTVEIDIRPRSAQVLVGDTAVGFVREFDGPVGLLHLAPGLHSLGFAAPGYMTLRRTVRIEAGGTYRIKDRLREGSGLDPRSDPPIEDPGASGWEPGATLDGAGTVPAPGRLMIRSSPPDAAVYLDGEFVGRADELSRLHGALAVGLGDHLLEVVRPGFLPETRRFEVEPDEPVTIVLDLQPTD